MPRDKKESHERIILAARNEFLKMGFEKASIRRIASSAKLTSAALYRHFPSKHEMFSYLVEPGICALREWLERHEKTSYEYLENDDVEMACEESAVDLMNDVIFHHREAFILLLRSSQGTEYENFIGDIVTEQRDGMMRAIGFLKSRGYKVKDIPTNAMHILMSAYLTALFEPIAHDLPKEEESEYLETIKDFFMPGWQRIMGLEET